MTAEKKEPTQLSSRIAEVTRELYQLAYVHVDDELRVAQVSPNFPIEFVEADLTEAGVPLDEAFGEFVGMDETLKSILNGSRKSFEIERVNRL